MKKPRGFVADFGPLNLAPPSWLEPGPPRRLKVSRNVFRPVGELLAEVRAGVVALLAKGGGPEPAAWWRERWAARDGWFERAATLPRRVREALALWELLGRLEAAIEAGDSAEVARLAVLVGAAAVRLHVLPWERFAVEGLERARFERLPPGARMAEGARRGQARRWAGQRTAREGWRARAVELWRAAPDLSAVAVARLIAEKLPEPRPAVSTVRGALRGLRPAR